MLAAMRTYGRKPTIAIWPMCSPSKARSPRRLRIGCRRGPRLTRRKPSSSRPRLIWRLSTFTAMQSHFCLRHISMTQEPDVRKAIELLDEAVKRHPSFFDAYCRLARAHEWFYAVTGSDHTTARLALAEAALQAATRLRPDAAETHLSRAEYLYYGLRDYAGALAELEIARRVLPNDPRLFELTGYILQGRGQQEEGLQNLQRAVELDPRNFNTLQQIAMSYEELWRYAEAIAALDRSLAILPDNVETRANRAEYELFWKAHPRTLHQTIDAILAQGPSALARSEERRVGEG